MIRFVHVKNPLLPASSRESIDLPPSTKTVRAILSEHFGKDDTPGLVVSLNGEILPPERQLAIPQNGDCLVVAPSMGGGTTWRTLAQVAVAAAAVAASILLPMLTPLAVWAAAAISAAISIGGNLLINTFMQLDPATKNQQPSWAFDGPQMLARSGTPIPKGYGTFQSGGNCIASFIDLDGQNQYINALICFGFGPARAIGSGQAGLGTLSGIQINGKDISTYQDVQYYVRYGYNNQTPIPNFNRIVNGYPQDVQVTCSGGPVIVPGTGDLTQALQVDIEFPVGVFYLSGDSNFLPMQIIYKVEYSVSGLGAWKPVMQPLTFTDVIVYNMDGTINWGSTPSWVLSWTGAAPGAGIVLQGDNGPHNPGDVQTVTQTVTTVDETGSTSSASVSFTGEWQPIDVNVNNISVTEWTTGWVRYVNDTTLACFNRTSIYGLAPGKYDVRVTKYGSNNADNSVSFGDQDTPRRGQEVWIHSVNEIQYQDLSYPNMILIGIRALATNQISGAQLNVNAIIQYGIRSGPVSAANPDGTNLLPAALQVFEEDNPAVVAADMMLDPLYGGGAWPGIQPANLARYIDEWVAWADLCDQLVYNNSGGNIRRCVFNGIFENSANLWDQLNLVAMMSRAAIVPLGRDYGVFVDQADTPVQMFSMGSIMQDSFQENWLAIDDRANQIEVEFADSTRYYRTDNPVVVANPIDLDSGVVVKNTRIRGQGITIPAQAWLHGKFKLNCCEMLLRMGSFKCDVEAIACRPGDLIILQHDLPQWGYGGRLLTGNTTTVLNVDRSDLPFLTGDYSVIVLHSSVQRYTGTVSSAAQTFDSTGLLLGWTFNLSSFDNAHRVTRAIIDGVDCPILSSSAGSVLVALQPGFTPTPGQAYTLYDTDVMETAAVASANATQVTLTAPLSQAPDDYCVYFYGPTGTQKIVRVVAITRSDDFHSTISWIDYNPNVYLDTFGVVSANITTVPGGYTGTVTLTFTGGGGAGASGTATYQAGSLVALAISPGANYSTPPAMSFSVGGFAGTAIIGPPIGETSAQLTTNPGVTGLKYTEYAKKNAATGSYADTLQVTWQNGPNTAGVAIYRQSGGSAVTGQMQLVARLTGYVTSWETQVIAGVQYKFRVVGFDAADNYAPYITAPTVSLTAAGITANMLKGTTFQQGFTYWSVSTRSLFAGGDTWTVDLSDDGRAVYTFGSSFSGPTLQMFAQQVAPGEFTNGLSLILSGYVDCVGAGNNGDIFLSMSMIPSSGSPTVTKVSAALTGATFEGPVRIATAPIAIPAGTVAINVFMGVEGGSLSIPSGCEIRFHHILLESAQIGQTTPSLWTDQDVQASVKKVFEQGSGSGLRTLGMENNFGGQLGWVGSPGAVTVGLSGITIDWSDSTNTQINQPSIEVTGLTNGTTYYGYPYYDLFHGLVKWATPKTPVGSPAILSAAPDAWANVQASIDGRVPLAPGGLVVVAGSGSSLLAAPPPDASSSTPVLTITPGSATLGSPSSAQAFSALVTDALDQEVTWSVTAGTGTIDPQFGIFTGPGGSPGGSATIQAQSVANPLLAATATVSW